MPWRVPVGRDGVFLALPEAERQRVVADGTFTSVCAPSLMGEQQPRAGREVILSGKEGRFLPFGVGRVKNKGQVPKSGRMLKSPSSPHTSSILFPPLPSSAPHHRRTFLRLQTWRQHLYPKPAGI